MAIIKYHPWSVLNSIQDEINKAFGNSRDTLQPEAGELAASEWRPHVDIKESSKQYTVTVDLPGVSPEKTKVSLNDNTLTIEGSRESEKKEQDKDGKYTRMERFFGSFSRSFSLPSNIDADNIKAKTKNGVLELTIPKKSDNKTKTISIDVEK